MRPQGSPLGDSPLDPATEELSAKKPFLDARSRILQAVRRFFVDRQFMEVETPVRIRAPAQETHIDAEPSGCGYLRTSPELHMKRLLAAGYDRVFQIGPCFRHAEQGRLHSPEFTMLEWYRSAADYMDMLVDAKALLDAVVREVTGKTNIVYRGREIELMPVWECFPVRDVFLKFAGWDVIDHPDPNRFDFDLVDKVEPALPLNCPVVVKDYPAHAAALARCKEQDPRIAERWELYVGGMELANAFSELTDPSEQRRRFEQSAAERRQQGRPEYPVDEAFLAALQCGLAPCAGTALGIDRLTMLLSDAADISDARPFRD